MNLFDLISGGFEPHCQCDRGICACGSIDLLLSWLGRYRTWRRDSTCRQKGMTSNLPHMKGFETGIWWSFESLMWFEWIESNVSCCLHWKDFLFGHQDLGPILLTWRWQYVRSQLDGFCWNCRILLWMHQFCHPNVRRPWQQGNFYPNFGSSGQMAKYFLMFCHHLCVWRFKGAALIHIDHLIHMNEYL